MASDAFPGSPQVSSLANAILGNPDTMTPQQCPRCGASASLRLERPTRRHTHATGAGPAATSSAPGLPIKGVHHGPIEELSRTDTTTEEPITEEDRTAWQNDPVGFVRDTLEAKRGETRRRFSRRCGSTPAWRCAHATGQARRLLRPTRSCGGS